MHSPTYKIHGNLKPAVKRLWYKFYPQNFEEVFSSRVKAEARPDSIVLEIGAGSGTGDQQAFSLKGKVSKYVGIDLDPRVLTNPHLDEAFICDAASLPFQDNTFDLVFHTMVAEHLASPNAVLSEIQRVLKPKGILIFETVNRYYYPMLAASLTPHWFHSFYIKKFASGRQSQDVFPTVYKLNTAGSISHCANQSGFSSCEIQFFSIPPGYLRSSRVLFLLGVTYERLVERIFKKLRGRIIAKLIK